MRTFSTPYREVQVNKTDFSQLYLHLLPKLYNLAMSILRNQADAQDAVQETALKAWQHNEQIRSDSEKAYITRILINECYNTLRIRNRIVPAQEILEDLSYVDPDLSELQDAIDQLPEKLRTALLLVYQEGYSYREASQALRIHPSALRSRLKRAKKALRSQLIEWKEE